MNVLKPILRSLSLLFSLVICQNAFAYDAQRGNVTATLGPYIFRTNYEGSNPELNSPNMGGISLTALGDVSDTGSLEIIAIYMNKIYFRGQDGYNVAEKTQLMHISMGYRRWFGSYFSGSLGVYTSYPMGESQIVHDSFPAGKRINTTASEPSESGLDAALQLELWGSGRYALVFETRYSYSLTKMSSEYADQYGGSLGIRYFIQGNSAKAVQKAITNP